MKSVAILTVIGLASRYRLKDGYISDSKGKVVESNTTQQTCIGTPS